MKRQVSVIFVAAVSYLALPFAALCVVASEPMLLAIVAVLLLATAALVHFANGKRPGTSLTNDREAWLELVLSILLVALGLAALFGGFVPLLIALCWASVFGLAQALRLFQLAQGRLFFGQQPTVAKSRPEESVL